MDFRGKYYEERLMVYGYLSEASQEYVHLAHDQGRLTFGDKVGAARIQVLWGDYGEAMRNSSGIRVVLFAGTGKCDGVRTGRIMLRDCASSSRYRGRRQQ